MSRIRSISLREANVRRESRNDIIYDISSNYSECSKEGDLRERLPIVLIYCDARRNEMSRVEGMTIKSPIISTMFYIRITTAVN